MSMLPSDTPRLPKWPFLVGDAVLLGGAVLLATRSPQPYSNPVILTIGLCVALASILGVIPFLTDYANKQDEALDERQRGLEALMRTVADSGEQISVAAASLHELSESARQQTPAQAPPKIDTTQIEEKLAALSQDLAESNEALRQEIKSLHKALRDQIAALKPVVAAAPAKPTGVEPQVAPIEPPTKEKPAVVEPAASPAPVQTPAAGITTEPAVVHAPTATAPVEADPKPAKKSPPAKKTKTPEPEVSDKLAAAKTNEAPKELSLSSDDPEPDFPVRSNQRISPDGATRLLVTAYIGIGNRLFIRGDGAGLNSEKGVPLQFVSIGKWQWETKEARGPIRVRLYKNDEIECVSLGEITLESGHQAEVSASF